MCSKSVVKKNPKKQVIKWNMCYFGSVVGCIRCVLNQRGKKEAKVWAYKVSFNSKLESVMPHFYLSVLSFIIIYVVMIDDLMLTFQL